jgi:ADP-ribose pyrophosphatase YjhB (NUDIX family)
VAQLTQTLGAVQLSLFIYTQITMNIIKRFLVKYPESTWIRTFVKLVPTVGGALDFLLDSKARSKKSIVTLVNQEQMKTFERIKCLLNDSQEVGENLRVRKGPTPLPPVLIDLGQYKLDVKQKKASNTIKRSLKKANRPNDPCAVLVKSPDWDDEPLCFRYHTLFYSDIRALREVEIKPTIITANALLFSEEENCLLLHRRSQESDEFPYTLHTFGGVFMPHGIGERSDIAGLKECVTREIHEETGLSIFITESTPIVTIDEFKINYIQVSYLGVNISASQMKDLRPNWEGTITKVSFDDLPQRLNEFQAWTPTGWVDVLLWLALNTPNASRPMTFSGISAEELCHSLVTNLTTASSRTCFGPPPE